jgi:DNA gyrase subunit A
MGLRPEKGHVKSARVVGEVMGRLHPHGDGAIYDALVRMAQPFTLSLPLLDGHGNFGSVDDGPAAMRYTECRLAASALSMTESIDENTVDFMANYDGREEEPQVLPAAFPALLVNGAAGIAVGMATSMAPHNLGEVIAAAKLLLAKPKSTLAQLIKVLPGPDLPSGGQIVGTAGIFDAYQTGRGSFKMRASAAIEDVNPRRKGIVITALPYNVGPERVVEKIKELVTSKKIEGIANITDLTDYDHGLRLVIEIKSGYQPAAVLAKLYKSTPLEESFNINNVALVEGQPKTLSLIELLEVFLAHRLEVVTRRSEHRRKIAKDRLHLVDGLLVAVLEIDEVIAVIRGSDDTAAAKQKLMQVFDLTEIQTQYILEMPLRRLTKFSVLELENEKTELKATIKELTAILNSPDKLREVVAAELDQVAKLHAVPRRTIILSDDEIPLEIEQAAIQIPDQPCIVLYSQAGLLARTESEQLPESQARVKYDAIAQQVETTTRSQLGLITTEGRLIRINVVDLPVTAKSALVSNVAVSAIATLRKGERIVGISPLTTNGTLALATELGVIKRVELTDLPAKETVDVISLKTGDSVIGCGWIAADDEPLGVLITEDARLLQFELTDVRAQGRNAAGVAGIKTTAKSKAIGFFVCHEDAAIITITASANTLPGTGHSSIKVTELTEFSITARGGAGVRCHKFRKGDAALALAYAGQSPVAANAARGAAVELPQAMARDATGEKLEQQITALGSLLG